jgi:phospholipase C
MAEKKEIVLDLSKSYNWYDTSIKVNGKNTFEKRFAGRAETGEPGKSDPFMGRV